MSRIEGFDPIKIANASGFPFQVAVESFIRAHQKPDWQVGREHPWTHPDSRSGYADLVVTTGWLQLVIECKRLKEHGTWVFAIPDFEAVQTKVLRCQWLDVLPGNTTLSGVHDFGAEPASLRSAFCAVHGSGESDVPMLERICGGLLDAAEAIAEQERLIAENAGRRRTRILVPVIVTNASLKVCVFDPSQVALTDGKIPGDTDAIDAPVVRFQKPLRTDTLKWPPRETSLADMADSRQRTVVVVNAASLGDFLSTLKQNGSVDEWPWDVMRTSGM